MNAPEDHYPMATLPDRSQPAPGGYVLGEAGEAAGVTSPDTTLQPSAGGVESSSAMPRPVFADPKTDFVFKRIFGSEARIVDVTFLSPEQRPKVSELKHSIVDVKCIDARGTHYVVEMQVLNVEGFEKRVVYNVAKAYTNQLEAGSAYPELDDVIGISICDFELWPHREGVEIPMLSHWRMQERHSGTVGLPELQLVFLELPKYSGSSEPESVVDKWAYFFREAQSLEVIPPVLQHPPLVEALEAARTARFSLAEWDAYIAAGMAIQNERGAMSLAHRKGIEQGIEQGRAQELRTSIADLCELLGVTLTREQQGAIASMDAEALSCLREQLKSERRLA
jgi:predicted transposase/invertase (TIGR01784 family)